MSGRGWSGRKVRRLVNACLAAKGTTCHLCGLPGANSADHDPPRGVLEAEGVPDPDAMRYLFPSHRRPCNESRRQRPITPELRAELLAKRLAFLGRIATPAPLSPRFARRRPVFEDDGSPRKASLPLYPPNPGKNAAESNGARP